MTISAPAFKLNRDWHQIGPVILDGGATVEYCLGNGARWWRPASPSRTPRSEERTMVTREALPDDMQAVAHDMGFRHHALIHYDDLRGRGPGWPQGYPAGITERIIGEGRYRCDPIIGDRIFADNAILWSEGARRRKSPGKW